MAHETAACERNENLVSGDGMPYLHRDVTEEVRDRLSIVGTSNCFSQDHRDIDALQRHKDSTRTL